MTLIFLFIYRLLVGAPRGQSAQPGTNRSGTLYKCKLSNNVDDCTEIAVDYDPVKLSK